MQQYDLDLATIRQMGLNLGNRWEQERDSIGQMVEWVKNLCVIHEFQIW